MRRVLPRSSQIVARDRVSRKRRSWLMRTRAERSAGNLALQPLDGRQVEMVGRLVEEQDVGRGRQHPRQRGAPGLAARQRVGSSSPVEAELLQEIGARDTDRRRGRGPPRHRRASSRSPSGPAPAAGSARSRRAGGSARRDRPRPGRRRFSGASTCRSRCGRRGKPFARSDDSSAPSRSGAPPKVSPMFCSVRSGGAMLDDEQRLRNRLAGGRGFEPRPTESESAVLPLNYPPPNLVMRGRLRRTSDKIRMLRQRSWTGVR